MVVSIVAGVAKNGVIGVNNGLPWSIPEDLKNFKKLTQGGAVIMGRKTYESIGKPLPNRHNIVVSTTTKQIPGAEIATSIEAAIALAKMRNLPTFVIGGAQIYAEAIKHADLLHISHINREVEGDTFFPEVNFEDWKPIERKLFPDFEFVTYKRKNMGD